MLQTPQEVAERFDEILKSAGIADHLRSRYRRWLRFYLDFCARYRHDPYSATALRPFCDKLEAKGQEARKRQQASSASRFYCRLWAGKISRVEDSIRRLRLSLGYSSSRCGDRVTGVGTP